MRFNIVALLLSPIFQRAHSLVFDEKSVSDTAGSFNIQQLESDSLPDDSLVPLSSYDPESHFVTASGDPEVASSTVNGVDGCHESTGKKNSKARKRDDRLSCPAAYDIQTVKVEECTPAKKLCPIFLEPLCCTGIKRNNGFPFSFDVASCIACMYMYIFLLALASFFAVGAPS